MGVSAAVPACSDAAQCRGSNVCSPDNWHTTCSGHAVENDATEFNKLENRRGSFVSGDVVEGSFFTEPNDTDEGSLTPRRMLVKAYSAKSSSSTTVTDRSSSRTRWSGWSSSIAQLSSVTPREDIHEPLRFCAAIAKEKGDRSFGFVHVPMLDGTGSLAIVSICDNSPVAQYNARQCAAGHQERMLCSGDRITAVGNCSEDLEEMRLRLRRSNVRLTVERWPDVFAVSLCKKSPSDSFGMKISCKASKEGRRILSVDRITNGQMDNWNKTKIIERRHFEVVTPGAEIVHVNGSEGEDVEAMEAAIKYQTRVLLRFRRPTPEALLQTWHQMAGTASKQGESRDMAASEKPERSRKEQDAVPRFSRLPEAKFPNRPRTRAV